MKFRIGTLRNHRLARLLAQLSNRCTVILSSGSEIYFNKSSYSAGPDNSEPLSDDENKEYLQAMKLIGF